MDVEDAYVYVREQSTLSVSGSREERETTVAAMAGKRRGEGFIP